MDASAALTALSSSIDSIPVAIDQLAKPSPFDTWSLIINAILAVLTFAAVGAAVWSAVVANRSLKSAQAAAGSAALQADISAAALGHERIRDLIKEFDDRDYFLRMWRLDMLTRDLSGVKFGSTLFDVRRDGKHPRTWSHLGPSDCSQLDEAQLRQKGIDMTNRLNGHDLSAVLRDGLGPEISPSRADFYGVYWFALRVHDYLSSQPEIRALELSRAFGVRLVVTFSYHRFIAARLLPASADIAADYYGSAYGLNDPAYAETVRLLYEAGSGTVLPDDTAVRITERETVIAARGYRAASLGTT